jgi:DNA-binding YbaB/EbfC family protein
MDMLKLMKQAQAMQARMGEMQAELDATLVEGQSGAGMVALVQTVKGELKSISIDPSLLQAGEKEILEDLIVAAHADARAKALRIMEDKMQAMTGGIGLPPGLKLF